MTLDQRLSIKFVVRVAFSDAGECDLFAGPPREWLRPLPRGELVLAKEVYAKTHGKKMGIQG